MRLHSGLLAAAVVGLVLTGCQSVDAPNDSGLKAKVDTSIIEAAQASEQHGDYASAAGYYNSVFERDPTNIEVAVGLSRNLRYLEKPRKAEAIMERALRKAPKDPALLAERGKVHLANLEAAKAVEVLSQAEQATPGKWDIETALGVGFDRLSLFDEAERHYKRALELAPDNAVVLNNYGLSLAQRGELEKAIEVLRRAASQPDATAKTRQNLAMLYALSGDLIHTEELVRRDLPPELADKNMAHYRQLAANRRYADVAALTREAAERSGLGGAGAIESAPLAPLAGTASGTPQPAKPAAPAKAEAKPQPKAMAGKTSKPAAAETTRVTAMTPVKPTKAAKAMPDKAAPPPAAKSKPGPPTPLTKAPDRTAAESMAKTTTKPTGKTPPAMADKLKAADAGKTGATKMAKAEPAKPPARAGTPYKLQLASFRREAQAMAARKLLQTQYKDVLGDVTLEVTRITLGKRGDFYRVLSAALDSRAAAADLCRVLKTRNADCLLVRADKKP